MTALSNDACFRSDMFISLLFVNLIMCDYFILPYFSIHSVIYHKTFQAISDVIE